MSRSRKRPSHLAPRPLDDVRALRAGASNPDGRAVGNGLEIDAQGRYAQRLGRAQAFDERGASYLRVGGYLGYLPGSPERLVVLPGQERKLTEVAVPTIAEVEKAPAQIAELDNRTTAFLVDHEIRIDALETAPPGGSATITQATIDFGTTAVSEKDFTIVDAAVVAPTYKILVSVALDADTAENPGTEETLVMAARAGTGQFTLRVRVAEGGAMRGTLKVNYQVAA